MTSASHSTERRAVIDVGTNSVKLLVADVTGRNVNPLLETSEQTRLGKGLYETHHLQPVAIVDTVGAVGTFVGEARRLQAGSLRIIGTSAARDATNAEELVSAIQAATGLTLQIISGDQEADWAFQGVMSHPDLADVPVLILDVGGGSSEFILGDGRNQRFSQSYKLGTVRLMEQFPTADPPKNGELRGCLDLLQRFLNEEVNPRLGASLAGLRATAGSGVQLVGVGGTSTILARMKNQMDDYDRNRLEATRLSRAEVIAMNTRLWSLPVAERRLWPGLPAKRADVILFGALIFATVMERLDFSELRVSTRGLRYAALMDTP